MSIEMRYMIRVTCDACHATHEEETSLPIGDPVPAEWINAAPIGEKTVRQFCSAKCFSGYKPNKPWRE